MSAITKSAKGEQCTVRIIGYCNGNNETTVLAHLSGIRFGHGTGRKVNDIHGAYCCSSCHDALDGRVRTNHTREQLQLWHLQGVIETQIKLIEKGLIE
jgi:uncharacterized protein YcfJ